MFLWSLTHGLLTISMACRIDHCPEFGKDAVAHTPLDLFKAFGPMVREGIMGPAATARDVKDAVKSGGD
jgi:hypothetical protein